MLAAFARVPDVRSRHGRRYPLPALLMLATLFTSLREAGWVDAGLVLGVEATVRWPTYPDRPAHHEVRYFLCGLPATTMPSDALRTVRHHWHVENRLHWPRDVTLGEDACQVRSGPRPAGAGRAA